MFAVVAFLMGGCGQGGPSYLPISENREWTYATRTAFNKPNSSIKVGPKIAVGKIEGRVLLGDLGESRVAWDGPVLIASQLANARFNPPIPMFREDKLPASKKQREEEFVVVDRWKGKMDSFDQSRLATAALSQRRTVIEVLGKKTNVVESLLMITLGKSEIEIRTLFERGKGIVKQEQRSNRNLVVSIELIDMK
jgi:predicted small lipoprotein YifL